MQVRLAKKIVQRVQVGDVTHLSYPRNQVEDAFRMMGVPLTPELLQPWAQVKTQEDPAALAARQEANRLHRQQALARQTARRLERAERRNAALAQAARQRTVTVLADHIQGALTPYVGTAATPASIKEMAAAAGRAAFAHTMQTGEIPTAVEIVPAEPPPASEGEADMALKDMALEDMTVAELKEWAKAIGLKGYSAKKKDELIAMVRLSQA